MWDHVQDFRTEIWVMKPLCEVIICKTRLNLCTYCTFFNSHCFSCTCSLATSHLYKITGSLFCNYLWKKHIFWPCGKGKYSAIFCGSEKKITSVSADSRNFNSLFSPVAQTDGIHNFSSSCEKLLNVNVKKISNWWPLVEEKGEIFLADLQSKVTETENSKVNHPIMPIIISHVLNFTR